MTHGECLVIEIRRRASRQRGMPTCRLLAWPILCPRMNLRAAGAGAIATDLRDWMPESIRLVFVK